MTALQVIGLVAIIIAAAAVVSYLLQAGKDIPQGEPYTTPSFSKEELENIKLAEELYNKDLRPAVARKVKPVVVKELEVVEPEFVAKVVETSKILPPEAVINAEALVEVKESKPEFPIDKPAKKKRKYHRKTKK